MLFDLPFIYADENIPPLTPDTTLEPYLTVLLSSPFLAPSVGAYSELLIN